MVGQRELNWQRLLTFAKYTYKFVLAHSKKYTARSKNSAMLQDHILQTWKMLPKIDQRNLAAFFYSALCASTALVIGVCLSRMPQFFTEDRFLPLDCFWLVNFYDKFRNCTPSVLSPTLYTPHYIHIPGLLHCTLSLYFTCKDSKR